LSSNPRSIAAFAAALPVGLLTTDPEVLEPCLTDWRGQKKGRADALARPRTRDDCVALVKAAAVHGCALVPQGGNTGLVGGSVPEPAPSLPTILVSMRRMNRIRAVDGAGLTLIAEAGAILANVHAAALEQGCAFPLSLGAKGSATLGGLVSTNAGGTQVLRHGTMRGLVLGLEAVLPDGAVLDQLTPLRKDSAGYDIKQLLIGAEGTLGLITAVALRLVPAPAARAVAWAGVESVAAALALLGALRARLGERIESFELMPDDGLTLVLQHIPGTRAPLAGRHPFHCLVEVTDSSAAADVAAELENALAAAIEAGIAADATVARSEAQANALWQLREALPEAERLDGPTLKNDVAVAVAAVPRFHAEAQAVAAAFPGAAPLVFGHLGDGNLHWNLRPPAGEDRKAWLQTHGEAVRRRLHDIVKVHGGTISAEHGIGTLKATELARLGDPGRLAAMRAVKAALDPKGIMNPGKLFV
jgi:FAD/FMN-containing dehydrogenase